MRRPSRRVVVAVVITVVTVGYGARAAAFMDFGGDMLLADLLINSMKQLAVATESLAELRRSYAEVRKVAEYADDAANAARSFQGYSAQRFGERFLADLDAVRPDVERFRQEALGTLGMKGTDWALTSDVRGRADSALVLDALRTTFGGAAGCCTRPDDGGGRRGGRGDPGRGCASAARLAAEGAGAGTAPPVQRSRRRRLHAGCQAGR